MCGDTRFRNYGNATQHLESGYCPRCPGRDNARRAIIDFSIRNPAARQFLNMKPAALTYCGDSDCEEECDEEFPFACRFCVRVFRTAGALLQHTVSLNLIFIIN